MADAQRTEEQAEPMEEWRAVLADFVAALRAKYGDNLDRVLLFGSRARGDYDEDSDVDLIVVLRHIEDNRAVRKDIRNLAYELSFGSDRAVVVCPIVYSADEWDGHLDPPRLNVGQEGVLLAGTGGGSPVPGTSVEV